MRVEVTVPDQLVNLRGVHELCGEAGQLGINRQFGRRDEVSEQVFRVFIPDGVPDGGGTDPGLALCGFVEFGVRRIRRAAHDRVGLAQADHVVEGRRETVEEALKRAARHARHVRGEQRRRQAEEHQLPAELRLFADANQGVRRQESHQDLRVDAFVEHPAVERAHALQNFAGDIRAQERAFDVVPDISHMTYARDHREVLDFIGRRFILSDVVHKLIQPLNRQLQT